MFRDVTFIIGSHRDVRTIRHREIKFSIVHLRELVLSSLRGIRQASSMVTATTLPLFKMWVPEAILIALCASKCNLQNSPPSSNLYTSSSSTIGLNMEDLQKAFVTPELDGKTVAGLIQVFLASNPSESRISMITISDNFAIARAAAADSKAKFQLLCRTIEILLHLPSSIRYQCAIDLADRALKTGSFAGQVLRDIIIASNKFSVSAGTILHA